MMFSTVEESKYLEKLIGETVQEKLTSAIKEIHHYKQVCKEYEKQMKESEKDKAVFRDALSKVLDEVDLGGCY